MAYSSCSKEEIVPVDGDDNSPIDADGSLVRIVPLSSLAENSDRYTFPGREVCLAAVAPEYEAIPFHGQSMAKQLNRTDVCLNSRPISRAHIISELKLPSKE